MKYRPGNLFLFGPANFQYGRIFMVLKPSNSKINMKIYLTTFGGNKKAYKEDAGVEEISWSCEEDTKEEIYRIISLSKFFNDTL